MPAPTRTVVRHRRFALAAIALVALAGGFAVGVERGGQAGDRTGPRVPEHGAPIADEPETRLTLTQQVGQTVILRFEGTVLPSYVEDALAGGEAAGVVLFGDNVGSPEQVRDLTRGLQRAAGGSALIAIDQEGGPVRILPFAASSVGQAEQGSPDEARSAARRTARELGALGVNVNLAPVADVSAAAGAALAGRTFPGSAPAVGALVEAAVEGYGERRVAATAKHFPGLGGATENTDDASVTVRRGRSELEQDDLEPFRSAIRAGVALIMVSHASYPALDRERIASQSPAIVNELLRGRLGFDGVVMTDSLEAEASLAASDRSVPVAATRAIEAGADLALTTGNASYGPVVERMTKSASRSPELRARVEQAAGRVLDLKRRLGLDLPSR